VGIPHCHRDDFVAQKLLYGADIKARHYQAAGKRVPQAMPAKVCDLGSLESVNPYQGNARDPCTQHKYRVAHSFQPSTPK
jgi:hypothetical protein